MSSEYLKVRLEDELDALFRGYVEAGQAPGLVYGLVAPDGLTHHRAFGVADDAGRVPTVDTVFPIASMSKSFVACAALIAQDRGLVSLDDPITKHVPEFRAISTDGAESGYPVPTLRQLFSMAGGLTEDNSWVDPFIDQSVDTLLEAITHGVAYSHIPGTVYEYSNLGYTLAGLAVGRAVGQTIEEFTKSEVFEPLGLSATFFDNEEGRPGSLHRASGYSLDAQGKWTAYPPVVSAAFAAAGGIQSTVRDLTRWVRWLGAAFRPDADQAPFPLSAAGRRELQQLHQLDLTSVAVQGEGSLTASVGGYALGLRVQQDLRRGLLVSHSGGLPGFKLFMVWHPGSGWGIVTLTNSHRGDPIELTRRALMRTLEFHDAAALVIRMWPDTLRLREQAELLIRDWTQERADQIFADNIAFDRPMSVRRQEIEDAIERVGPLLPARPASDVLSTASSADVTWTIPGARGDLVVMIHLTPVMPARIQEFEVSAATHDRPVNSRLLDISTRRTGVGPSSLTPLQNVRVELPDTW